MVEWTQNVQNSSLGDLQRSSHNIGPNGLTSVRVLDVYALFNMPFHNLDEVGDTMYIGLSDGESWLIKKLVTSESVLSMSYAVMADNETYFSYGSAWVDRENLVYVNLEGV